MKRTHVNAFKMGNSSQKFMTIDSNLEEKLDYSKGQENER